MGIGHWKKTHSGRSTSPASSILARCQSRCLASIEVSGYLIQTDGAPAYHLRGAKIVVCDDGAEESVVLLYQGKPLPYRVFARHELPSRIADDKSVDAYVERAKQRQASKPPRTIHGKSCSVPKPRPALRPPDRAAFSAPPPT